MTKVYPIIFKKVDDFYLIYVPDFDKMTQATNDLYEVLDMARDLIGSECLVYEDNKQALPVSSDYTAAIKLTKANVDDDKLTLSDGTLTYIDIDTIQYRKQVDNHIVRKNVSIPNWLNTLALERGINFSQVLQDGLKAQLNCN